MTNLKTQKSNDEYGYYSKKLNRPFDTLTELRDAEEKAQKQAEEKAAAAEKKKNEALAVENAYKALNAAKRTYKEDLTKATDAYAQAITKAQTDYDDAKLVIRDALAKAENHYKEVLKEFTDKHPEGFHITLKDGDYETTISSNNNRSGIDFNAFINSAFNDLFNLW